MTDAQEDNTGARRAPDPAYAASNMVTLLTAEGKRMTKKIPAAGEKLPADTPLFFTYATDEVADLEDLFGLLRWLEDKTDTIIVRPAVIEGAPAKIRRKSSGPEQALIDVARSWVMIDIDGGVSDFPADWMHDPTRHIKALIVEALPKAFYGAGVIVQFSSSMNAGGGTPRVHLWFWLSRSLTSLAAKRWLKGCPIDFAICSSGQPHFTAAPIFESGVDPLGEQRLVFLPGPEVAVPSEIDLPAPNEISVDHSIPMSRFINQDFGDNRWRARIMRDIGDHEGGLGLHPGILSAAMAYVSCHYDPQAPDPKAAIDYSEFEQAVLAHVGELTLSPERKADLDERLRDMERSFWGAVPRVEEAIRKAGWHAHPLASIRECSVVDMVARIKRGGLRRDP